MIDRSEAEEHLRVIRSLMEKATIYRAISAEAAAVGGALAIGASFTFGNWWTNDTPNPIPEITGLQFVGVWGGVLAIVAAVNVFFLWNAARKRSEAFASAGMRMAVRALLPPYLVAAVLTVAATRSDSPNLIVPVWITCHGLGLLATGHFAPRSLMRLGWVFVAAGLTFCLPPSDPGLPTFAIRDLPSEVLPRAVQFHGVLTGQKWMAFTFGLFHLIYAACTWPRRAR